MTTRTITTDEHRNSLVLYLKDQKLPFTVIITKGKKRSVFQNNLQRMWILEISEQLGDLTPEEIRGYCKLTIGVPILRAENDDFCEKYDAVFNKIRTNARAVRLRGNSVNVYKTEINLS